MLIPIYQHVHSHYFPRLPASTHARITATGVITNTQQAQKDLKSLLVNHEKYCPQEMHDSNSVCTW